MDLYRAQILDHYKHPHNFGRMKSPDVSVTRYNSVCGDRITIGVRIHNGKKEASLLEISFYGEGCAISLASASLLTDYVKGKGIDRCMKMTKKTMLQLLETELTPARIKCALLPLETLQKAILEWKKRNRV